MGEIAMASFAPSINKAMIFQLGNQLPNFPGRSLRYLYYGCGTPDSSAERARHRCREARRFALLTLLEQSRATASTVSRATGAKLSVRLLRAFSEIRTEIRASHRQCTLTIVCVRLGGATADLDPVR
jgi:hypothetical protein